MSKSSGNRSNIKSVSKLTSQGGRRVKTSSLSKTEKRSRKPYRGQGR